jgi:hypothetical protein
LTKHSQTDTEIKGAKAARQNVPDTPELGAAYSGIRTLATAYALLFIG